MPETHDTKPYLLTKGPLIVSLESCFWHLQKYPRRRIAPHTPPLSEPARPRELQDPFRRGEGRVFRLPLTRRAVVIGYWVPAEHDVLPEEESGKLLQALEGAHIPGITATEIADWARPRIFSLWDLVLRWLGVARAGQEGTAAPRRAVTEAEAVAEHQSVPWDDSTPVIDLEDARVRGQGKDATIVRSFWAEEQA